MKFYVTVAANMPHGAGCYEIHATDRDEARRIAFAEIPEGRWSFMYDSLEAVHPLDRTIHGVLGERSAS